MKRRFQFSLRALFIAMLCTAFYFGGVRSERERRRRADEAAAAALTAKKPTFARLIKSRKYKFDPSNSGEPISTHSPDFSYDSLLTKVAPAEKPTGTSADK